MRTHLSFFVAVVGLFLMPNSIAHGKDRLVMFDSPSCPACIQFRREAAGYYAKSKLGRQLPLRIVNATRIGALRKYKNRIRPIAYTPTFVLMRNGREVARSVGYNGRRHFMRDMKRMSRR